MYNKGAKMLNLIIIQILNQKRLIKINLEDLCFIGKN